MFVVGALLALLQISVIDATSCLSSQSYTRTLPVNQTQWTDKNRLVFPQFDPSLGQLDFARVSILWNGTATYFYSYHGQVGRVARSSQLTPSLTFTQLGLSYPANGIDIANYNLLFATFNQDFAGIWAYNKDDPARCPDPNNNATCDVNVFYQFFGQSQQDITDLTTLTSFTGLSTYTMGAYAAGAATGTVMPGTGGAISGTLDVGIQVTVSYFGTRLTIDKRVNGVRAFNPPGPTIQVNGGGPIQWTYNVTNYGAVPLNNLVVTDDQGVQVTCPVTTVAACGSVVCTGSSNTVQQGQYRNNATCTATGETSHACPPDRAHYFGSNPSISIQKFTNGFRPDAGTLITSQPVTWKYAVSNPGNVVLTSVTVTDNKIGPVTCPLSTLAPTSVFTCSALGTALAGAYSNVGTAQGFDTSGLAVTATDISQYTGGTPSISIVKFTNGVLVGGATSQPLVLLNGAVTWKYAVTNNGGVLLTNVFVHDNKLASNAICPTATLAPSSVMTCSATGLATAGQYDNVGTATGFTGIGSSVISTAPSSYFGVVQTISVNKFTNGVDIRLTAGVGPVVLEADPVTWTYFITNTGNVDLTNVALVDNKAGAAACPSTATVLSVGSTFVCSAAGVASAGAYTNVGSASGISPLAATLGNAAATVTATSPSAYFGIHQAISVVKSTNNVNTNSGAARPFILLNDLVTWRYAVTNTGNSVLSSITVTDNQVAIPATCPSPATLAPTSSFTCTLVGSATTTGIYNNVGTATGVSPAVAVVTPASRATVTATSPSSYFGVDQHISVVKFTNDVDIRSMSAPTLLVGSPVTWKYAVTNTGNAVLSTVSVADNKAGNAVCPTPAVLAVGSTFICTATGVAVAGAYTNIGTARGVGPTNVATTSTSPSSYTGAVPGIQLLKLTNGVDIRSASAPQLLVSSPVTWTYIVTNSGTADMSSVVVSDNQLPSGSVSCPATTLAAGLMLTCVASGTARASTYTNVGTVSGVANGVTFTTTNPSGYFGVLQSISVKKYTNDVDIRTATAPTLLAGGSVTWKYAVTNTGNSLLSVVGVVDDQLFAAGLSVTCPSNTLNAGATFTCSATGVATAGPYNNVGTAHGISTAAAVHGVAAATVTATSPSSYFGANPAISLSKLTNDIHVDVAANAIGVDSGEIVTWKYVITNTGTSGLSSIAIVDDKVASSAIKCPTFPNPLAPGGVVVCSATALVPSSNVLYHNTATASGSSFNTPVSSVDQSWYNPVVSNILVLKKKVNTIWTAVDEPPRIRVGCPVTWTYEVTNAGTAVLSSVSVTDEPDVGTITCPTSGPLAPQQTMTCTALATAADCAYSSVGTATGSRNTRDVSGSAYIGIQPIISLQKWTNTYDHATVTSVNDKYKPLKGPCIMTGSRVTWTYVVSNIGDDLLTNVIVEDDQLGPTPVCSLGDIAPWYSRTCFAVGFASAGQYHNQATATGQPATSAGCLGPVTARDENWFIGALPDLKVTLLANDVNYYDPLCDICRISDSASSSSEGEGQGEGNSVHGNALPEKDDAAAAAPVKGIKLKTPTKAKTPTTLATTNTHTASNKQDLLGGDGFGLGPDGKSIHTIIGPDGRSIHDEDWFNGGKKLQDPDGKSIHTITAPDGTVIHLGEGKDDGEGQGEGQGENNSGDSEGPCEDFNPRNLVVGEATGKKGKDQSAGVATRRQGLLGGEVDTTDAHQDTLSGNGEGKSSHQVHTHTPLAPPSHCNTDLLPTVTVGSTTTFRFLVENTGSELLEHVYLQLGDICEEAQDSGSSEGEGSVHGNAIEVGEKALGGAANDRHIDTLSTKGGTSVNSVHIRKTTPADVLGDKFGTKYIICPQATLDIGERMICNVTKVVIQSYGVQQLTVKARGVGVCTSRCVNSWSAAQWYTPAPPTPPPVSSSTGATTPSEGNGESSSHKTSGCNVNFWKSSRAPAHFPSGWTGDTLFATAANLATTADPTAGLTISQVLWSRGYDIESKFFRSAAAALLNAATISNFGLTSAQVQSTLASTWTEYKQKNKSSTLQKAISSWDSSANHCPFY